MRDRSYQWLKDATSFGLLSDQSTEKLKGEIRIFAKMAESAVFGLRGHGLSSESDVTHMRKGYFRTRKRSSVSARWPVWRISNFSNIWT